VLAGRSRRLALSGVTARGGFEVGALGLEVAAFAVLRKRA
jgi:hypothetical protein